MYPCAAYIRANIYQWTHLATCYCAIHVYLYTVLLYRFICTWRHGQDPQADGDSAILKKTAQRCNAARIQKMQECAITAQRPDAIWNCAVCRQFGERDASRNGNSACASLRMGSECRRRGFLQNVTEKGWGMTLRILMAPGSSSMWRQRKS